MLFEEAINIFLENCKALERSENTIVNYKRNLNNFNKYLCQEYNRPLSIDEVKVEDLQKFIFKHYNPKDFSSSIRHNIITSFKSLYSYLARKELCENKGKLIKNERVQVNERETLSEIEFRKVILYVNSPTAKTVLFTLYYSGVRISEALKLKLCDVDLEEDIIHVKDTKNKEDRAVPINMKLKKVLKEYLENDREDRKTDNFFSTYPLGKICAQQVNKHLRRALECSGIEKKISAHNLRHSFASNIVQRNVDIITLKNLLGHKRIRTTSIYCHANLAELQEAVNIL